MRLGIFDDMITISTNYLGDLRAESTHLKSSTVLITDAPTDNEGKGQSYSPTDLLATALGTCMITVMGIAARNHGIDIQDTKLEITKVMASSPRRVSEIHVDIFFNKDYSDKQKMILETAGRTCPVALSLHPELLQKLRFIYK